MLITFFHCSLLQGMETLTCLSASSNACFCPAAAAGAGCTAWQAIQELWVAAGQGGTGSSLTGPHPTAPKKGDRGMSGVGDQSAKSPVTDSKGLNNYSGLRTNQDIRIIRVRGWAQLCSLAHGKSKVKELSLQGVPGPEGRGYLSWTSNLVGCYCSASPRAFAVCSGSSWGQERTGSAVQSFPHKLGNFKWAPCVLVAQPFSSAT